MGHGCISALSVTTFLTKFGNGCFCSHNEWKRCPDGIRLILNTETFLTGQPFCRQNGCVRTVVTTRQPDNHCDGYTPTVKHCQCSLRLSNRCLIRDMVWVQICFCSQLDSQLFPSKEYFLQAKRHLLWRKKDAEAVQVTKERIECGKLSPIDH